MDEPPPDELLVGCEMVLTALFGRLLVGVEIVRLELLGCVRTLCLFGVTVVRVSFCAGRDCGRTYSLLDLG